MEKQLEGSRDFTSIGGALLWAVRELARARVDSPRMTAELLLGYALGWERVRIISHPGEALSREKTEHFTSLVSRRARGEPLQYLTGEREFYGRSFRVTPAVLIPRPETEILVEKALYLARSSNFERPRMVDVGTGSGCIAISVARELPQARVWALDISAGALAVARENACRHGVLDRIPFLCGDLLECFPPAPCFDFILSNPPYVAYEDAASLEPMVRNHEPQVALFGGNSGLQVVDRLILQAASRLGPGGFLLLEIGAGMSQDVACRIDQAGLQLEEIAGDLQGIPRCALARRRDG